MDPPPLERGVREFVRREPPRAPRGTDVDGRDVSGGEDVLEAERYGYVRGLVAVVHGEEAKDADGHGRVAVPPGVAGENCVCDSRTLPPAPSADGSYSYHDRG